MRLIAIFLAAIALHGCSQEPAEEPSVDIEQMNKDALGPAIPVTLDPITFAMIEKFDLFGAGCNFRPEGWSDLALIADGERATVIIEGKAVQAAPDAGSKELPYASRSKYDGLTNSFELQVDLAREEVAGYEVVEYPGSLIIRDDRDQVVFDEAGTYECGA